MKTLKILIVLVCVVTTTVLSGCHCCPTLCCHHGTCHTCAAGVTTHTDCPTCQP